VRRLRVAVAVLGDLARSPRMLYHAQALTDGVADVDLVGYVETPLEDAAAADRGIRVHRLRTPAPLGRAFFALRGLVRVLRQSVELLWTLLVRVNLRRPASRTCPAPTLFVGRRRGGRRADRRRHNFGCDARLEGRPTASRLVAF
jgi:hypothetical protein